MNDPRRHAGARNYGKVGEVLADEDASTITLVLMRHAKSDWSDPTLTDHDRPLNGRGVRDAPRMAARLAKTGFQPDLILASTAVRASMTADALGAALGVPITPVPNLYGASARTLISHAVGHEAGSIVLVAHDPGMSDLAAELSGGGITHMPTAAVATFIWNSVDWDAVTTLEPDTWTLDTPRSPHSDSR